MNQPKNPFVTCMFDHELLNELDAEGVKLMAVIEGVLNNHVKTINTLVDKAAKEHYEQPREKYKSNVNNDERVYLDWSKIQTISENTIRDTFGDEAHRNLMNLLYASDDVEEYNSMMNWTVVGYENDLDHEGGSFTIHLKYAGFNYDTNTIETLGRDSISITYTKSLLVPDWFDIKLNYKPDVDGSIQSTMCTYIEIAECLGIDKQWFSVKNGCNGCFLRNISVKDTQKVVFDE